MPRSLVVSLLAAVVLGGCLQSSAPAPIGSTPDSIWVESERFTVRVESEEQSFLVTVDNNTAVEMSIENIEWTRTPDAEVHARHIWITEHAGQPIGRGLIYYNTGRAAIGMDTEATGRMEAGPTILDHENDPVYGNLLVLQDTPVVLSAGHHHLVVAATNSVYEVGLELVKSNGTGFSVVRDASGIDYHQDIFHPDPNGWTASREAWAWPIGTGHFVAEHELPDGRNTVFVRSTGPAAYLSMAVDQWVCDSWHRPTFANLLWARDVPPGRLDLEATIGLSTAPPAVSATIVSLPGHERGEFGKCV